VRIKKTRQKKKTKYASGTEKKERVTLNQNEMKGMSLMFLMEKENKDFETQVITEKENCQTPGDSLYRVMTQR
jgi:hypothetical protein